MADETDEIANLLLTCEEKGIAPSYIVQPDTYREQRDSIFKKSYPVRTKPVDYETGNRDVFVVSDLHIAGGRKKNGVYKGTENFFADDSFFRFLTYAHDVSKDKGAVLVINGDIFDFLRVTEYPGKIKKTPATLKVRRFVNRDIVKKKEKLNPAMVEADIAGWVNALKQIGINKTEDELKNSISKIERIVGLETDDYKTIYKLLKIRSGHANFFNALANWLKSGNKLLILKGNHDLELYWPAIRNYFRLSMAEIIHDSYEVNPPATINILTTTVLPNIHFIDDSVVIDKDFYVEHGHRYDTFTMVVDSPVLKKNPSQINIPFGSFFNRYLINKVELVYPFIDNVKPQSNLLPMLLQNNFILGIKILIQHVPLVLRVVFTNFRYLKLVFHRVFWVVLALLLPLILIFIFHHQSIINFCKEIINIKTTGIYTILMNLVKDGALALVSYLLVQMVAWFQLSEPSCLEDFAKLRLENTDYTLMTMGHTHNPGQYILKFNNGADSKRYYNTGTWIPVIDTSTTNIREDLTYTFIHLVHDAENKLTPVNANMMQRWNDDAQRADTEILMARKTS